MTLAFIGWTDANEVTAVASAIRAVAGGSWAATLSTGGLGAFPSAARARVLWYGINDPDGVLARVMTFISPAAPMVVPLRTALGAIEPWEVALSIAMMIAAITAT